MIASSSTAMAKPPLSRTARRIRKSPTACGTRMPAAIVCAFSQRAACSTPSSKARTIGAQPAACTATMRGRFVADEADRLQLGERLPHADQPGAAAGRIEDRRPAAPSRAARPARAPSSSCPRSGRAPSASRCRTSRPSAVPSRDDLAAIVDQPVDAVDAARPAAAISLTFTSGVSSGQKTIASMPAAAGVSRERGAGIAVGRHRHLLDAELLRHRHRHHQAARLERAGRQPAFVLDQRSRRRRFRELRQRISGVIASPRLTMSSARRTGSSSR